jgi:hypothetical protein
VPPKQSCTSTASRAKCSLSSSAPGLQLYRARPARRLRSAVSGSRMPASGGWKTRPNQSYAVRSGSRLLGGSERHRLMASPIGSLGSDPRLLGLTMGVGPDRTLGSDPVHQGLRTCPKVRPIKQLLPPLDSHKNEGEKAVVRTPRNPLKRNRFRPCCRAVTILSRALCAGAYGRSVKRGSSVQINPASLGGISDERFA